MITISKAFETFRKDINKEESVTLAFFEKILSSLFIATLLLGIPLLTYMLIFT